MKEKKKLSSRTITIRYLGKLESKYYEDSFYYRINNCDDKATINENIADCLKELIHFIKETTD